MASAIPQQMAASATAPMSGEPQCTAFRLPSDGIIIINETQTITLDQAAVYVPECPSQPTWTPDLSSLSIIDYKDPFYESTIPQVFVLGAMLIVAWSLVIILVITPRTQLIVGGHAGSSLGRGGAVARTANSATVIGVGGRPWLQKVAATTVAISLLIATVNTFKVVEGQYEKGYDDAVEVTTDVVGSKEIRIIRVISDTFLWLAQAQTVIRLFPRHKEKVIIKWAGFGLITLDTLFSILNNFVPSGTDNMINTPTSKFNSPIPALSYLFGTLLSLTYAACVLYYSWVKGRFAYFHPKMRNICVVALLSVLSILVPVVFFVMDIVKPTLIGWGDYVRWVGAAAASVVVWEWVERIEALEREERKEGILGREVFDGDEMLQMRPSIGVNWPRSRFNFKRSGSGSGGMTVSESSGSGSLSTRATRPSHPPRYSRHANSGETNTTNPSSVNTIRSWPPSASNTTSPAPVASPILRSNTNSAASTVYVVVRQSASNSASPVYESSLPPITSGSPAVSSNPNSTQPIDNATPSSASPATVRNPPAERSDPVSSNPSQLLRLPYLTNPFKRRRHDPPPQVSQSAVDQEGKPSSARTSRRISARDLLRVRRHQPVPVDKLPIVVVPAQPRNKVWTPPVADASDGMTSTSDDNATKGQNATSASTTPDSRVANSDLGQESAGSSGEGGARRTSPMVAGPSSPFVASSGTPAEHPSSPPPIPLDTRPSTARVASVMFALPVVQEQTQSFDSGSGAASAAERREEG